MVTICLLTSLLLAGEPTGKKAAEGAPPEKRAPTPAGAVVPVETRLDKLQAEQADVPVEITINVRNEMGKRFRLIEAILVVDGVEVARRVALQGEELEDPLPPIKTLLPSGNHVLTATLVYEGRNVGIFNYMDEYKFRVESTLPFESGHLAGPATVDVVAHERPGATVPLEDKPVLTLTATNEQNVATQRVPTGLAPARAVVPPANQNPRPANINQTGATRPLDVQPRPRPQQPQRDQYR